MSAPETAVPQVPEEARVQRGLKGVHFARSGISDIDGRAGELRYRGYSIHDLAEHATFEEICHLMLAGDLPTAAQLAEVKAELAAHRPLQPAMRRLLDSLRDAHPMTMLRTAVSALSAQDPTPDDLSPSALVAKGTALTSQAATLVAAHHRLRRGLDPVEPDASLSHAASFLHLLSGERPSAEAGRLMDIDLILHAEHGANASSFAARVVAATGADFYAAMTAAIGALSGPAHGGAAEDVMRMVREIGDPEQAAAYVRRQRDAREPIMGFGHRVYRVEDPRARHLRSRAEALSREKGDPRWFAVLQAVVDAMRPYSRLGVNVNVDFYAGVIYHLQGIPQDLFVPVFALGRIPGWTAHIAEQVEDDILIRPLTTYSGEGPRSYRPIAERG
jgi:citrate synthase